MLVAQFAEKWFLPFWARTMATWAARLAGVGKLFGGQDESGEAEMRRKYTMHELLGQGAYGRVMRAVRKSDGQEVAIKIIDLEEAEDEIEDIQQEITVLAHIDSPYVTKYYGSYLKGPTIWIVMEYLAGGSCLDLVRRLPARAVSRRA